MYDVLCYGALCADHRLWLPHYPAAGAGIRIQREEMSAGGNAFIEARSLAAWGRRVALMGDHLGDDAGGRLLAAAIRATTIDDRYLVCEPQARTPRCYIMLTPDAERSILAARDDDAPCTLPPDALLARCRVVSVTRYGPRTAEAARLARVAGRLTVLGDATHPDDAWAPHADVIVTSASLLAAHQPGVDRAAQMAALHHLHGATVIVTDGPQPVHALWREEGETRSAQVVPPRVTAHNSIGAGDVFRAAVVHGVLHAWPWPQTVEFACHSAAAHIAHEA